MTILSFVVIGLLAVFGVSALVEFYKKTIRGGNAKAWENWIVGGVLSIGVAALLCFTGIAWLPFGNLYLNWAVYSVVIFLIQLLLDMKVIKKILASALENVDIVKLATIVLPKLGLTAEKIKNILNSLGIDKDTLVAKLIEAGMPEDKVKELADYIYGVEETNATKDPS